MLLFGYWLGLFYQNQNDNSLSKTEGFFPPLMWTSKQLGGLGGGDGVINLLLALSMDQGFL